MFLWIYDLLILIYEFMLSECGCLVIRQPRPAAAYNVLMLGHIFHYNVLHYQYHDISLFLSPPPLSPQKQLKSN